MEAAIKRAGTTYGKKLFAEHLVQYTPEDPLYEHYTDDTGMERRRKRALPPGLSKRDANILKSVKKRAHYLDKGFHICGLRFGWTFLIGLIPIVGDVTDAALNYRLVVHKARKADIPDWLLRRMLVNNAVSAGIGLIPLVGDIILAMYKANSRNALLLEEFLRIRGEEFIKMGGVPDADDHKGWLSSLISKATAFGVNPKDAEQVKPGAGMTAEEMKMAGSSAGPSVAVASGSMIDANQDPTYGTFNKKTKRSTMATDSTAVESTTHESTSKPTKGNSFFFGSQKKRTTPPGGFPVDKGKFVENVQ